MRVHDHLDNQGRIFAFEVANIGRRAICYVAEQVPDVHILRVPGLRSRDQFCEFEINGRLFVIEEPFGDNSRYWVGPEPPSWCEEINVVRNTFVKANAIDAIVLGNVAILRRFM